MLFKGARVIVDRDRIRDCVTTSWKGTSNLRMLFFNVLSDQVSGAYNGATAPQTVRALQA